MHPSNINWWVYAAGRWAKHFAGGHVLEVGSFNVNGSIRPIFKDVASYTGADWRKGPNVNLVSLAHDLQRHFSKAYFKVIVSASMLEHDPYWKRSLSVMVTLLRDDGILLLTWGASANKAHELHTAPDGKFHSLPAAHCLGHLRAIGLHIQEFRYEDNMPFNKHLHYGCFLPGAPKGRCKAKKSPGCVVAAAVKRRECLEEPVWIDAFELGDNP